MKKPKTVVDLLVVADECIKASEAHARLLDARGKGYLKKKQQEDHRLTLSIAGTGSNLTRRRRGCSGVPPMPRSGARSIA
jgi:hypothetical protein